MKEPKIASIRPSPLASVVGIVAGIVFLAFGLLLMADDTENAGGQELINMFKVIWVVFCIGIIVYNFKNLSTFSSQDKERLAPTAGEVIEIEPGEPGAMDFETRLRKLEALRRDGLVNEEEFKKKRREIMDEKW